MLWLATRSIPLSPIVIGLSKKLKLYRKLTNISLHLIGFSFRRANAKLCISDTAVFKRLRVPRYNLQS